MANLCYIVLYYLIGYRNKVVVQNLIHAFAHQTPQKRQEIAKSFYQHLCDLLVEHIKALTISPRLLLQQVTIKDIESIEKFYRKGQSIILVAGHFGNWEWIADALALQTSYTITAGYQPLHHKEIDRIVLHLRTRFQRKAIPLTALFKHIKSHKGAPEATTLLIDQAPLHSGHGYATTFLTQPTTIGVTAAKLAQQCNQPIFYIHIERIKRGKYQAKPILLAEKPTQLSIQEIAAGYTRRLEANILENPAFWLWSHRRWK